MESVADLRDMGLGFGDIFKLTTLSTVLGVEVDALLASALVNPETGEYELRGVSQEDTHGGAARAAGQLPENFGAIVSAGNRHHGRDEHQPDATTAEPTFAGKGGKHGNDG